MNLRRVLILADESADWMVAGLRQLDRLALSIDEFAVENNETSPVLVAILWRDDLDQSQRWVPIHPRLTKVAFTTDLDNQPYDLILSTRLFLYRKAIAGLLEQARSYPAPQPPSWENFSEANALREPTRAGGWEFIADGEQIDDIERRFLRGSGKSQDGFVSRHLNRPISRSITRLLLRFPATPNGWTWLMFPIPVVAALALGHGTYWSFVWGLILFQIFSILDGCDGEIARAKFMESESGRRLDDLFDVFSNILLVLGLGVGLRNAHPRFAWLFVAEGVVGAGLIAINEWLLARRNLATVATATNDSLGDALYPRHRELVERSGLLVLGEKYASLLMQLTKRDVAVLFFVFLALIGLPSLILHLLLLVSAVSLILAVRARRAS
ncbi:MAG: CDP-alcohol phosphatidyltransferase family protein [Chthoniobacterales bacterium]